MRAVPRAAPACLPDKLGHLGLLQSPDGKFRFPTNLRIRQSTEFSHVLSGPDFKSATPGLLMLAKKNALDHPRLGLGIAKKHLPGAVDRNKVKRLVRESFRIAQHGLSGWDVVVLSRSGIKDMPPGQLEKFMEKHWQRLLKCDI